MPDSEARSLASLLDMPDLCIEDGSSLPMASYMPRAAKLQSISTLPHIHDVILLGLLWRVGCLGVEGDIERGRIYREFDAS